MIPFTVIGLYQIYICYKFYIETFYFLIQENRIFKVVSMFNYQCSCRFSDFTILSESVQFVNWIFLFQNISNFQNILFIFRQLVYFIYCVRICQLLFHLIFIHLNEPFDSVVPLLTAQLCYHASPQKSTRISYFFSTNF